MRSKFVNIDILKGKTLINIEVDTDINHIEFVDSDGNKYDMYHDQEYNEDVYIEDICGDINNLLNTPIILAEEVTNSDDPPTDNGDGTIDRSYTWTFYKLATIKGYVTIRWYGTSNGHYSETVDFFKF